MLVGSISMVLLLKMVETTTPFTERLITLRATEILKARTCWLRTRTCPLALVLQSSLCIMATAT